MTSESRLYCKLFVDADDISQLELLGQVVRCLGDPPPSVERWSILGPHFAIDVRHNEDFDANGRKEPDGFVHFRYYLDVDALPGQQRASQIALVAQILQCLWSRGYAAIAASDFEDELPNRGGYRAHEHE